MNFKPLHDRVLVRRLPDPPNPAGVVVIRENPDCVDAVSNTDNGQHGDYRRVPIRGVILAVGPGRLNAKFKFKPTTVKPGETVVFSNWNDWEKPDDPDLYLIREGDIWGNPDEN